MKKYIYNEDVCYNESESKGITIRTHKANGKNRNDYKKNIHDKPQVVEKEKYLV